MKVDKISTINRISLKIFLESIYEKPCLMSARGLKFERDTLLAGSEILTKNSEIMTAKKLIAFITKHHFAPKCAIISPASAGPVIRARLKEIEFSATAFGSSELEAMSERTRAWRDGESNAVKMPFMRESVKMFAKLNASNHAKKAKMHAMIIMPICAHKSMRSLSKRSSKTPENSVNSSEGKNCARLTSPTLNGSRVSVSAIQGSAIVCIHEPINERFMPIQ